MNPCSDASAFYALVRPACGRDLSSAECRKAVSGGVDKFGTGCLGLPIAEGNPIFPPFVGYVCDNATGRLGQQCGQYMPTSAPAGTGSGTGSGTGTGAAAAIGTIGALGGATVYAVAQKLGGMLRTGAPEGAEELGGYDEVDPNACLTNRLMCLTDTELDAILSRDNQELKGVFDSGDPVEDIQKALDEYRKVVDQARNDFRKGEAKGAASVDLVLGGELRDHIQRKHLDASGSHILTAEGSLDRALTDNHAAIYAQTFENNPYMFE